MTIHTPSRPGRVEHLSRRGRLRLEAGFTLIEVMVTALIVVLLSSAVAAALISTAHFSGDQRFKSQADALATQDQERMRGLTDEQLGQLAAGSSRTVTVGGYSYTVRSTATYEDSTGGSSCNSGAAAYYKITSTVSWQETFVHQQASVTEESLISRPVTGDLLAQVKDQTGQGLPGVTITATGPSTQSAVTDSGGCVAFAGLNPGSYTVTASEAGYVDPNGSSAPITGTATVTSTGQPATTNWNEPAELGQAGSIAATFTTAAGAPGEADGISWVGNSASQATQYQTITAQAPAGSLTTGALFPFDVSSTSTPSYQNNYTVWAGRCLQQEPPISVPDQYTVTPGSLNQAQNVPEPLLNLALRYQPLLGQATAVPPGSLVHVKLTFTSTAGAACSYSWYPTVTTANPVPSTGWLANPGQPFASTATSGPSASGASQSTPEAGSLTICADYKPLGSLTSYFGQLSNVTNADFSSSPQPTTVTINQTSPGKC